MRSTRREFLIGGIKVTAVLFSVRPAGALGQMARPTSARAPHYTIRQPPLGLDESLNLLAAYLVHYQPPAGVFPPEMSWKATYDLIQWNGSARSIGKLPTPGPGKAFMRENFRFGTLSFVRRAASTPGFIEYESEYSSILAAFDTKTPFTTQLRSHMRCRLGPIPSLAEWTTEYLTARSDQPSPALRLSEQGRWHDGQLVITTTLGSRRFPTQLPVAPQWAIIDALRTAGSDPSILAHPVELDLFQDLTSYRPRQRLSRVGTLQMRLAGQPYDFHGFLLTGPGTEPTHFWVDTSGRPLLITAGLLGYALATISGLAPTST